MFDVGENVLTGAGVQAIEHLRHRAHPTARLLAEIAESLQLQSDYAGNFVNDVGRDLVQIGHADGHVGPDLLGQRKQKSSGLTGVQVGKHQSDGLRMLAVDELGKLLGIGALQNVEGSRIGAEGLGQAVHQPL